jgi:DNA-binding response OmpR family regulator
MDCPKVLLIEDNRLVRWWMSKSLTREGFMVVAPASVDEALRLGTTYPFDVLVSDWRLPDGHDGVKVLATVRRAFPQIASILISAEADAELTKTALGAGFDRVIPKPLEMSQIVEAIKSSSISKFRLPLYSS